MQLDCPLNSVVCFWLDSVGGSAWHLQQPELLKSYRALYRLSCSASQYGTSLQVAQAQAIYLNGPNISIWLNCLMKELPWISPEGVIPDGNVCVKGRVQLRGGLCYGSSRYKFTSRRVVVLFICVLVYFRISLPSSSEYGYLELYCCVWTATQPTYTKNFKLYLHASFVRRVKINWFPFLAAHNPWNEISTPTPFFRIKTHLYCLQYIPVLFSPFLLLLL